MTKPIDQLVPDAGGAVAVSVDEGGVRCRWRSRAAYIPLAVIKDVSLEQGLFGGNRLVLSGIAGGAIRLDVDAANCLSIHHILIVELDERARSPLAPSLPALARDGRAIEEWFAAIARHSVRTGYRDAGLDLAAVTAVLSDSNADVEVRAAAAYALLTHGGDEHLLAVARVFVQRALPPLVLAAAHVARGGFALVPDDVWQELLPFLPPSDAAGLSTLRIGDDPDCGTALASAFECAKEEARVAAQSAQDDGAAQRSKWRRLHAGTAGADTRWVGKTWAL
jgi:hypothetical protein